MNTKRSDIGTRFAGHPEDTKVAVVIEFEKFRVVNSSYAELSFDSRYEGRSLEKRTG